MFSTATVWRSIGPAFIISTPSAVRISALPPVPNFGSGLNLPLLGLNVSPTGPSQAPEAPEAPQRPLAPLWITSWASEAPQRHQRPLRGPSKAPSSGSQFGPQRLGSHFGLGRVAGLRWPNIFPPPQCGGPCQLKKLASAKSGGRNGVSPPLHLFRHENGHFSAQ